MAMVIGLFGGPTSALMGFVVDIALLGTGVAFAVVVAVLLFWGLLLSLEAIIKTVKNFIIEVAQLDSN